MIPRSTIRRSLLLLIGSLFLGITVNQVYSEGIGWFLLTPQYHHKNNAEILFITADSAFSYHQKGDAVFIDSRLAEEFAIDHIAGAISIPVLTYYKSPEVLKKLNKNDKYIFYCFDPECPEAKTMAREFANAGFKHLMIIFGGFSSWLEKEYPKEP